MNRIIALIFLALFLLNGCGGGSSGTGVPDSFIGKVLTGSVVDENAEPVSGAQITVVESGENTTTDSTGNFSLESTVQGDISLLVGIGDSSSKLEIETEDTARTDLNITVNRKTGTANATENLTITAKIVGRCDIAFENNATIRQANRLASGTQCALKVTANSSGEGVLGIPYKLEHKPCDDSARWKTILLGLTDSKGVDQKSFKFFDTADFCDYRVVAAYGVKGAKQIIFPIATFQRQAIDKDSKLNLKILSKQ